MYNRLEDYSGVMEKCSQCAYCQATCPVFLEDMTESQLARNRLNLINEIYFKQTMELTDRAREILARCLLCTNCTQTCSSQVPVDEILIAARCEYVKGGISGARKAARGKILSQRGVLDVLSKAGSLAQKVGIATKEMPQLASKSFDKFYSGTIKPEGEARAKVAYFVGCGTRFLFPDTGIAVVEVLQKNGVEVLIPPNQMCCGIPVISAGVLESAQEMVRTNIDIFAALEVDAIVTDCTSCGMMFKQKAAKCFAEDDPIQEKIAAVAGKMWEITDYLNMLGLKEDPNAYELSYCYHIPCHRGWAPTVRDAPFELLARIPQTELRELEHPEQCCGAAGAFFMQYRQLAESIRSHRLEEIKESQAQAVVTQCPVCRFYLSFQLPEQEVLHPISVLARAYGL